MPTETHLYAKAMKFARIAELQAGLPLITTESVSFSDDPAVNLERAAALLVSEADAIRRGRHG